MVQAVMERATFSTAKLSIIAIGGEPATGKTTLVQRAVKALRGNPTTSRYGLVEYLYYPPGLCVLGRYQGDTYAGTDRLSMSAERDARALIDFLTRHPGRTTVLFEGDRLFTRGFLDFCAERALVSAIALWCDPVVLATRRASRDDRKTEQYLRSRRTKVANIVQHEGACWFENGTPAQLAENAAFIGRLVEAWQ